VSKFDTTPDDRLLSIKELQRILHAGDPKAARKARLLLELDSLSRRMANEAVLPETFMSSEELHKTSQNIESVADVLRNMREDEIRRTRPTYWKRLWAAVCGG